MHNGRVVEAYCDNCKEVRTHNMKMADPGSCTCQTCDKTQQLMVPLA